MEETEYERAVRLYPEATHKEKTMSDVHKDCVAVYLQPNEYVYNPDDPYEKTHVHLGATQGKTGEVDCETCDGHGSVGYEVCTDCFGKGYEEWQEGVRIG